MCPQDSSGASPAREMKIELTDQNLTVGAILEMADVFEIADLKRACEFALSVAGQTHKDPLPATTEDLLRLLAGAVEFLRDRAPEKLATVESFVDGIAAQSYKQSRAKFRKSSKGSAAV